MEALHQPEYVHVLLNHLPVTGLLAVWLGLLGGLVFRNRAVALMGLALVSLFALSAWPVAAYGEAGYDRVYSMADSTGDAWLHRHMELGERWVWLFYLTAAAGAVGLVLGWKRPKFLWPCAWAAVILAAGSLAAGAVIADAGGKVRHREFRHGPAPALHEQSSWLPILPTSLLGCGAEMVLRQDSTFGSCCGRVG